MDVNSRLSVLRDFRGAAAGPAHNQPQEVERSVQIALLTRPAAAGGDLLLHPAWSLGLVPARRDTGDEKVLPHR